MTVALSRFALVVFLTAGAACAQNRSGAGNSLDGQLTFDTATRIDDLSAVLEARQAGVSTTAAVDGSGAFHFADVPAGTYQLRIVTRSGAVIASEVVAVSGSTSSISVAVKSAHAQAPPNAIVSAQGLLHQPNHAAVRAYEAAQKARAKGDFEKCSAKLREATRLDPQYVEAVHDLGVLYLISKRLPEAAAQFETALALDPSFGAAHRNLGAALAQLGRAMEAEQHLRKALQLDPGSSRGRYLLGVLYLQTGRRTEALAMLRAVAGEIPAAKELVAQLEHGQLPVLSASAVR